MSADLHRKEEASSPGTDERRTPWRLRALVAALPLGALLLVELGVRLVAGFPPTDPCLLHDRGYTATVSPFMESNAGEVTIRPGWVQEAEVVNVEPSDRTGFFYLLPAFRPVHFAREKSPETLRIFVLGDSTAFGLGVGADAAFAARLQS